MSSRRPSVVRDWNHPMYMGLHAYSLNMDCSRSFQIDNRNCPFWTLSRGPKESEEEHQIQIDGYKSEPDGHRFQTDSPMLKSEALDGILVFPLVDWLTHQMAPACPFSSYYSSCQNAASGNQNQNQNACVKLFLVILFCHTIPPAKTQASGILFLVILFLPKHMPQAYHSLSYYSLSY